MAVGTQETEVQLTIIFSISILVICFERDSASYRMLFAPPALAAPFSILLEKVSFDMLGKLKRSNTRPPIFQAGFPSSYVLSIPIVLLTSVGAIFDRFVTDRL